MSPNLKRLIADFRLSSRRRYCFAAATIALAALIRWLLNPVFGTDLPYAIFYAAIVAVAWMAGFGPSILGVALGILTADFLFMPPRYTFVIPAGYDLFATVGFTVIGIGSGALSEAYRRSLESSERAYRLSARQQAELQQIYASTPIGLGFLDENLRYLRVNDALASFNGVPADQHPGRHISEVLSPETAAMVAPHLTEVLNTGKPLTNVEFQGQHSRDSKEVRYVRASFYRVQLGDLRGIHGVVEDITAEKKAQDELRKAEEQLRYSAKMEAVGRLAGGVAHDFNNLLMVIDSYTELLLQQLGGDPGYAKKLNAISGAAQRAARLTRQLLAFGRKQPMQTKILDADSLVKNCDEVLRSALRENIGLAFDLGAPGVKIKIDPSQLEQVLVNLAVNARDAMPDGGRLAIRTVVRKYEEEELRSIFNIAPGEYVEISLSDSGCGMSPEVQAKIFDPFFTTKERAKGAGLGLAMVYGIVKQSGGYIEAQSAENEGTTFRIWLPTTTETSLQASVPVTTSQKGSSTILVAEDEPTLRQAICESLTALGYRVLEAADGMQALELIHRDRAAIDLLLTDAVMPNMSGFDLIQRVRHAHPQVKTMLMSGYANSVLPSIPGNNDGLVLLQKPFAQAELAHAVGKMLSLPV